MSQKIKVNVIGKGVQEVNCEDAQTIGDLRDILAMDANIQATDGVGKVLSDKTKVSDIHSSSVNFTPNVEGGI